MDWSQPIDLYCERTDAAFWSEPVNAVSNVAFLIAAAAAFVRWRRGDRGDWPALALIGVVTAVGIGSFTFHTVATRGAVLADVDPDRRLHLRLSAARAAPLPASAVHRGRRDRRRLCRRGAGAVGARAAAVSQRLGRLSAGARRADRGRGHGERGAGAARPRRWRRSCSRSRWRCAPPTSRYARRFRSAPISPGTSSMRSCSTSCCAPRWRRGQARWVRRVG